MTFTVAALYHFAKFDDYKTYRDILMNKCQAHDIKGILLLADEGINGTIAGLKDDISEVLKFIQSHRLFKNLDYKLSSANEMPFLRMKVRLKKEIVTLKQGHVDVLSDAGTYIAPEDWNDFIQDENTVVIDTRNDFEVDIGHFKGALNPDTKKFSDLPAWVQKNHNMLKGKRIAMYCTGGIRCEKSTAYMKQVGFDNVYHLKGGILKYLENINESESLWQGDCFVFDRRVAVGHGLAEKKYEMCGGCRYPLKIDEIELDARYKKGVYCTNCYDDLSDEQRARFAMRQYQIDLAHKRNHAHLGQKLNGDEEAHDSPILYSFLRCPYAMRARMALFDAVDAGDMAFIMRNILLKDKPKHMLKISPKGTVPVLLLPDETVLEESLDIMTWVMDEFERKHATPHVWKGGDENIYTDMLLLIDKIDGDFKYHLDHYKYHVNYKNCDPLMHRKAALDILSLLEEKLQKTENLFADRPLLADYAIFPFVRQFANVDKEWWQGITSHDKVKAWLKNHVESQLFLKIMKKYPLYDPQMILDENNQNPSDIRVG